MLYSNAYAGEVDGMSFDFDGDSAPSAAPADLSVAMVSSPAQPDSSRPTLISIVREVVADSDLRTRILFHPEAKELFESERPSLRLIVDLWSNSREHELRDSAVLASTMLR